MKLVYLAAVGLTFASGATAQTATSVRHVIIVSWDGGKPAMMQRAKLPNVQRMIREGAYTWTAETILPSITLPSHTSMVSGVLADKHGILWNDFQKTKPNVSVPTLFSIATKQGLKTACFVGKDKFRHWDVPGSMTKFMLLDKSSSTVAKAAGAYIAEEKPNVCFVHFPDTDTQGHKFGWDSAEQLKAAEDQDGAMALLMDAVKRAGIERETVIILSADHGGHAKTHGSALPADQLIPWIVCGATVRPGIQIKAPVKTTDTAATALWLLGLTSPENLDGKPIKEAFTIAPRRSRLPWPD